VDKFVKNYIDKHNGTFVYLRSQSSTLHVLSNIKTDEKYVLKLLLKKENYLGNLDMLKRRFKDIGAIDEIELVPIQEVGIDAKQFYKLYKYQKQSLAEYIENKILTVLDAVKIFEKILLSVEVLHKQGKAHGNLKLSNIFVDNEKKFVFTDFGFEKQIEDDRYRLPKDSKFTPMKQDIFPWYYFL
jgi:serine/threonine protein kinase